jgi:hypothetical protein
MLAKYKNRHGLGDHLCTMCVKVKYQDHIIITCMLHHIPIVFGIIGHVLVVPRIQPLLSSSFPLPKECQGHLDVFFDLDFLHARGHLI